MPGTPGTRHPVKITPQNAVVKMYAGVSALFADCFGHDDDDEPKKELNR